MFIKCEYCKNNFFIKPYRINKARFCSVKCRSKMIMGCYKFWQGKKRDKKTINKIKQSWTDLRKNALSELYTGKDNPMYNKTPWNKDKKCPSISNEKNGCWKGDSATYTAKHIWIKRKLGKAFMCINHLCDNISQNYQWANVSKKYKRDEDDWIMLCVRCHAKFDRRTKCQ